MRARALIVALALTAAAVAACEATWTPAGPEGPVVVEPFVPTAPPVASPGPETGEPSSPPAPAGTDLVHDPADSTAAGPDSLAVPRLVSLVAGETGSVELELVAGSAPRAFEILVAQDDTTAVRLALDPIDFHRGALATAGALTLADDWGPIASEADVIVPIVARFDSPGRVVFRLPLEARAPGRGLIHVLWQLEDGERLGLAVLEVQVR